MAAGLRDPDVVARSLQRLPLYQRLHTIQVDTTHKTAAQVAREIAGLRGHP